MNLGKNINSLLKRYPEVYVKGLGVFKRKHSAAQFDKQRALFLPPISYVEFDSTGGEGFNFIHYIQQQQNLNLDAATAVLQQAVADLKDQLIQNGQAKLEDLGHIVSYGSSLVFKPLDLTGFNFEPVQHVVAAEIETVIPDRELAEILPLHAVEEKSTVIAESYKAADEQTEESSDIIADAVLIDEETSLASPVLEKSISSEEVSKDVESPVEHTDLYQEEDSPKSNTIWYYISAAIIVVVSVIVAFLLNPSLKDQLLSTKKAAPHVATVPVDTLSKIDSIQPKQDAIPVSDTVNVDSTAQRIGVHQETTAVVQESVPLGRPNYQLVIGAHKTMALAEAEAVALRKKGYTTVRAIGGRFKKNKKRVIWNTYMTKDEAERDQATVVKTFSGAWVEKIAK
ncbi:hypothetical protein LZQ00_00580 [Sphingobacterium sp. SRCM116780]|uniref:hypothetical protein n=1 Tax=Sphingobacterium sp. SRCM116780 TaxID=2907623 RepID=UPI001F2E04D6|nr:hypothetical protein [Sphingobacterium sp. SRCM116780]UIR56337.1 hypothetical protein LZQ00_00580 [Sphingobacterium sp. SRCM116780]